MPADGVCDERARWLAELADAIEDAQRLAWRIGLGDYSNHEAMDLYVRLECARAEVEFLKRSGWAGRRHLLHPKWIDIPPADTATAPPLMTD